MLVLQSGVFGINIVTSVQNVAWVLDSPSIGEGDHDISWLVVDGVI